MPYVLETEGIQKRFGGTVALTDGSIRVCSGQVHALVGENGAGKSTLIKIITGVYRSDGGRIIWNGHPVTVANPESAQDLGIAVLHQHRALVPYFTAEENLFVGRPYPKRRFAVVDWAAMRATAEKTLQQLGVHLDLATRVCELTPAQQTMVEVARALSTNARLVILDEPTASLSSTETKALFAMIQRLKRMGVSFVYVSHRLEEVFEIADTVTVMRNGATVASIDTSEIDKPGLIALMAGESAAAVIPSPPDCRLDDIAISVHNLSTVDREISDVSFSVRRGEILGIYGLIGSGRTAVLEAIYGLRRIAEGTVRIAGNEARITDPRTAIASGIALIPGDRMAQGLVLNMSLKHNVTLPLLRSVRLNPRLSIINRRAESEFSEKMARRLSIKAGNMDQEVSTLSGGNQQKVVLARWIAAEPRVFLCDEPTSGVDVGARREIYSLLYSLASRGASIVVVSSDLPELLAISHRVGVMASGRLVDMLDNRALSPRDVLALCYGEDGSIGD